jgi:cold shock CspA family protein
MTHPVLPRYVGTVKTVGHGYGFVSWPDGDCNVFAHVQNLRHPDGTREFQVGQRLRYSVMETVKGPRAFDIEELD